MKRFSEQLKKKSETIRLRASERSDLRDRLTSYMEYHPLPSEMKAIEKTPSRKQMEGIISEPFKAISINMTYIRGFAGVFAIFMVVGVPIIAERAVPGDMLYAVKTNITEEVRASLKLSPYSKVEWETVRLERRVAEARLLASEGKLTPEVEAVVAQAVKEHTDAVTQEIAAIREDNEDEAAMAEIAFASALSVQSDVLEEYIENDEESTEGNEEGYSIAVLADMISVVSDEADVAQADATPSYAILLGSVETETTRAYELFESVQKHADEEEVLDIERRLADVERKLIEAIVLQSNDASIAEVVVVPEPVELIPFPEEETVGAETDEVDDSEVMENVAVEMVEEDVVEDKQPTQEERIATAIELLRAALTDVQKLVIFMTDISVREAVTVEELVPVTYTDEERTEEILNQLDTVLLMQSDTELYVIPGELTEKITVGNELLTEQLESVSIMLEVGNLDGAEKSVADASAIARDIHVLVVDFPIMKLTEEIVEESTEETEEEDGEEVEEEAVDIPVEEVAE